MCPDSLTTVVEDLWMQYHSLHGDGSFMHILNIFPSPKMLFWSGQEAKLLSRQGRLILLWYKYSYQHCYISLHSLQATIFDISGTIFLLTSHA